MVFERVSTMASAPEDSFLSSDQDTNQFWCRWGLNSQISYIIIRDFIC